MPVLKNAPDAAQPRSCSSGDGLYEPAGDGAGANINFKERHFSVRHPFAQAGFPVQVRLASAGRPRSMNWSHAYPPTTGHHAGT